MYFCATPYGTDILYKMYIHVHIHVYIDLCTLGLAIGHDQLVWESGRISDPP